VHGAAGNGTSVRQSSDGSRQAEAVDQSHSKCCSDRCERRRRVGGDVLRRFRREAGASSPADQGVTSTSIRIGIPVINFAALEAVGVTLNDGNFQDAFNALTAHMNAHGGVDGRKVVPYFVETNPAVTSSGNSSCSELTEDDKVFIVMFPVYPDCYQQVHDTPVIGGVLPGALPASAAPDFSLTPPDAAYDPVQLAAFSKRGVFKGKKVGIFYGADANASEVKVVLSDLKKAARRCRPVRRRQRSGNGYGGGRRGSPDHCSPLSERRCERSRWCRRHWCDGLATGASGRSEHVQAALDRYQCDVTRVLRCIGQGRKSLPGQRAGFDSGAVGIRGVEWTRQMQRCAAIVRKAYPSDAVYIARQIPTVLSLIQ
jgi:hypothetical protein